eukprot:TRINITY_DN14508_c0_g1_i1.p1 TRINITY_DN14508_c0_g1~~TRINITY_DN14508_c0_g1_i1.p1  ORF type:complete len:363 (+),score=70.84 TRINITY_DN14508_c0_g1_i1:65-1153(+)
MMLMFLCSTLVVLCDGFHHNAVERGRHDSGVTHKMHYDPLGDWRHDSAVARAAQHKPSLDKRHKSDVTQPSKAVFTVAADASVEQLEQEKSQLVEQQKTLHELDAQLREDLVQEIDRLRAQNAELSREVSSTRSRLNLSRNGSKKETAEKPYEYGYHEGVHWEEGGVLGIDFFGYDIDITPLELFLLFAIPFTLMMACFCGFMETPVDEHGKPIHGLWGFAKRILVYSPVLALCFFGGAELYVLHLTGYFSAIEGMIVKWAAAGAFAIAGIITLIFVLYNKLTHLKDQIIRYVHNMVHLYQEKIEKAKVFVHRVKEKTKDECVHCMAGVSRSRIPPRSSQPQAAAPAATEAESAAATAAGEA